MRDADKTRNLSVALAAFDLAVVTAIQVGVADAKGKGEILVALGNKTISQCRKMVSEAVLHGGFAIEDAGGES